MPGLFKSLFSFVAAKFPTVPHRQGFRGRDASAYQAISHRSMSKCSLPNNREALLPRRAIDDGLAYRIPPFEFFMGVFNVVEQVSARNLNR
jgi:hypothetical protein